MEAQQHEATKRRRDETGKLRSTVRSSASPAMQTASLSNNEAVGVGLLEANRNSTAVINFATKF